jgi:hypothetical protein
LKEERKEVTLCKEHVKCPARETVSSCRRWWQNSREHRPFRDKRVSLEVHPWHASLSPGTPAMDAAVVIHTKDRKPLHKMETGQLQITQEHSYTSSGHNYSTE